MNISSICRNFDDLQTLLARINVTINIIGITETRLNKSSIRNTNIDLSGYSFQHTPTEANCGGALLYIDNNINYIVRDDLCIYRSKNTIVGCVYRHPCMNPIEFIELLQKFSKEGKIIMLMEYFNIDLLKYDHNTDSASFLDSLYANFLLPYISTHSRVTTHSRTLIDNIFSNNIEDGIISGNIISTISDHYAQFLLMKIKKLSNKDKKTMKKPWITKGILKSIEKKNRIYRKCIRTKNDTKKRGIA